jgi:Major tropism determinant N-terminal domain
MATQLQLRKGNTAQTAVFTGALAEVTVDTDQDTVVVHDGTTVGGHYIVTKAQLASNVSILQGINTTQNTNITSVNGFAAGAFNAANGANGLAQGAYNTANTNSTNISIIQGVDLTQNTNITAVNNYAASAYAQANTNSANITAVNGFAQSAFNTANGANGLAAGAYNQANSAYSYTTQVEAIAQNGWNRANAAFASSNLVNQFAQSAYNQANSATLLAQSAYDTANLKFNTSGGNINGDVVITANNDLTVTGNLYVFGNTTSFGTQTLEVVDPMILLATGNYSTDLLDIGFAGSYNDGANAHTGLFRESTVKEWYFFEGYTPEVSGNNNINIADASFRKANVNANFVKGNLIATTAVVGDRNILSYTQAAFDTANTANTRANDSVAKSGDTMTGSLTGVTTLGATTISLAQVDATSNTFVTSSTSQVSVDAWPTSSYRSAKYFVQVSSGTDFHIIELNLVHNGTTVFLAQYGEVLTSSSLGTFDADISGSTVRLLFTGVNSVSTIKLLRTVVDV